jgi:hypothetical protein
MGKDFEVEPTDPEWHPWPLVFEGWQAYALIICAALINVLSQIGVVLAN